MPVDGMDAEYPTSSSALTDDNGAFAISTYKTGDGAPEGEYVLTFKLQDLSPFSGYHSGPERSGLRSRRGP